MKPITPSFARVWLAALIRRARGLESLAVVEQISARLDTVVAGRAA